METRDAQTDSDGVLVLTGGAATEGALKQMAPGNQVLHILNAVVKPKLVQNPLLLSGLALACANQREQAGPNDEDGILTAQEIAALDLSIVRWAVLSACETGTGEVLNGEGIFGLRRAFRIAGARTLITSLWSVKDEATRQWMNAFYKAGIDRGLGAAEAVREADLTVLNERREKGEDTHPFYWGGFIASGDWR